MHDNAARSEGDVAVVIPAAGEGKRMGGRRKQFKLLDGKSLLYWSAVPFAELPDVSCVVVAVPPSETTRASRELSDLPVHVIAVEGGTTRQDSVRLALDAVAEECRIVLVHDAVRPFIETSAIRSVIQAVRVHGAAALAVPVVDTLRRREGSTFRDTVPRDDLVRMQTPQGFLRELIVEAHRTAWSNRREVTDDVALAAELGNDAHMIMGSPLNFKVTTSDDWELARIMWPAWKRDHSG